MAMGSCIAIVGITHSIHGNMAAEGRIGLERTPPATALWPGAFDNQMAQARYLKKTHVTNKKHGIRNTVDQSM